MIEDGWLDLLSSRVLYWGCGCYYLLGIICIPILALLRDKVENTLFHSKVSALLTHGKCTFDNTKPVSNLKSMQIPKRLFAHFYIFGAGCMIGSIIWDLVTNYSAGEVHSRLIIKGLLVGHLLRRWIETLFVMPYSPASHMHVLHYVLGLSFYLILTLSIHLARPVKSVDKLGLFVFIFCCILQYQCHSILGELRGKSARKPKGQGYGVLPHVGLFKVILCPHYLAEIGIYWGVFLMSNREWLMFLNLIFVLTNLTISAYDTKLWYYTVVEPHVPRLRRRYALFPLVV